MRTELVDAVYYTTWCRNPEGGETELYAVGKVSVKCRLRFTFLELCELTVSGLQTRTAVSR